MIPSEEANLSGCSLAWSKSALLSHLIVKVKIQGRSYKRLSERSNDLIFTGYKRLETLQLMALKRIECS